MKTSLTTEEAKTVLEALKLGDEYSTIINRVLQTERDKIASAIRIMETEDMKGGDAIDTPEFMDLLNKFAHESSCEEFNEAEYSAARKAIIANIAALSAPAAPSEQTVPKYWADGTKIIEQCFATAAAAKHEDAPFPLNAEQAALWHKAQMEAYRHALEMMGVPSIVDGVSAAAPAAVEVKLPPPDVTAYEPHGPADSYSRQALMKAISAAVAAERESCAAVCDRGVEKLVTKQQKDGAARCASMIRNRK